MFCGCERDVQPKNGSEEFFSHDMYNRYSMAPTFSELWEIVSRRSVETSETPCPPEPQQPPAHSNNPGACALAEPTGKGSVARPPLPEPRVPYPRFSALSESDQRNYVQFMIRYKNVHRMGRLQGKVYGYLVQYSELRNAVQSEMPEFMKYLQNAARTCAEDYDAINPDALRYTEEVLGTWNEGVKKYPELYTISEMTSIMGGKFIPDLTLRLEKKLLCMGRALFLRVPTETSLNQLPTDYKTISAFTPPPERASAFESRAYPTFCLSNTLTKFAWICFCSFGHQSGNFIFNIFSTKDISGDVNAEKLSAKYGAKVCLTSQALFALLNNCGPNYTEPWEVPVRVKTVCGEGNKMVKVVFMDSPLAKKELTVREKNLLFYKVPLDLLMSKKYYTAVPCMTLDMEENSDPAQENMFHSSEHQRTINTCEGSNFGFHDFTELETFGTVSSGPAKPTSQKGGAAKAGKRPSTTSTTLPAPVTLVNKTKQLPEGKSQAVDLTKKIIQEKPLLFPLSKPSGAVESNTVETIDCEGHWTSDQQTDAKKEKRTEGGGDTLAGTDSDETTLVMGLESERDASPGDSDSDGERLIIDTGDAGSSKVCEPVKTFPSASGSIQEKLNLQCPEEIIPDTPQSPSPERRAPSSQVLKPTGPVRKRKVAKPLSKEFDPVGQILRMQCKLLKPSPKRLVDQPQMTPEPIPAPGQLPLDRNLTASESQTPTALRNIPGSFCKTAQNTSTHKNDFLTEELQTCEESASDYTAPATGNVTYKLFSLSDLLLIVRGNVQKAQIRPRSNKGIPKKHVPIYLLPKLEYQSAYGIEVFTESEICQLWTESLLNSNTWFYIGHIDVFTSKLIWIDQFPAALIGEKFGTFNPVNSLNILHHILKKVSSLPEGQYLLSHPTGDSSITIYRTSPGGKFTRAAYNLHTAHSKLPPAPSTLSVPWVPLDPDILLPYHKVHGRAPCTFPPRSSDNLQDQKVGVIKTTRGTPVRGKAVTMETRSQPPPAQHSANEGVTAKKKKNKVCSVSKMAKIHDILSQVCLVDDDAGAGATVKAFVNFNAETDATELVRAIKTKGVDEHAIIDVLTRRSNSQRQDIAFAFERQMKKKLEDVLNSALCEPLKSVLLGLLKTPAKYDASEVKGAIKGLGTNEATLIEILCSRTNKQMQDLCRTYQEVYKKEMKKEIEGDTSGDFRKLLCALVKGSRSEPSNVEDMDLIDTDARELYEAGVKKKGTDVGKWITILTERSIPHLNRVFGRYNSYSCFDMIESIKKEVTKDLRNNFVGLVQCIQSTPEFFADKLSLMLTAKGDLKKDVLTRVMVSRCEIDLLYIRKEFKKKTGKSLHQCLTASTKGDYQRALLALCGGDD
uniref:little elongation complex subunit 2-like isoform X2 n=1 Tax=Pristiophorus japonicus TaxID=55135 RepID=UPI00398E8EE3